jgi:hypothetical protein
MPADRRLTPDRLGGWAVFRGADGEVPILDAMFFGAGGRERAEYYANAQPRPDGMDVSPAAVNAVLAGNTIEVTTAVEDVIIDAELTGEEAVRLRAEAATTPPPAASATPSAPPASPRTAPAGRQRPASARSRRYDCRWTWGRPGS